MTERTITNGRYRFPPATVLPQDYRPDIGHAHVSEWKRVMWLRRSNAAYLAVMEAVKAGEFSPKRRATP